MYWKSCINEPPKKDGEYVVLILEDNMWKECFGSYSSKSNIWKLWIDGFGWSDDSGYIPSYWFELPKDPPIPYTGPKCIYYNNDYCVGQKNTPHCPCQGNRKVCMYFD